MIDFNKVDVLASRFVTLPSCIHEEATVSTLYAVAKGNEPPITIMFQYGQFDEPAMYALFTENLAEIIEFVGEDFFKSVTGETDDKTFTLLNHFCYQWAVKFCAELRKAERNNVVSFFVTDGVFVKGNSTVH